MAIITLISEISKTNSLYGFAASMYCKDEAKASEFILELYDEFLKNPEVLINSLGVKTVKEIEEFATNSKII